MEREKAIREIRKLDAFKSAVKLDGGHVISRLDHSVILSYDGEGLVVPPRGRLPVANKKLLGALPKGVVVV